MSVRLARNRRSPSPERPFILAGIRTCEVIPRATYDAIFRSRGYLDLIVQIIFDLTKAHQAAQFQRQRRQPTFEAHRYGRSNCTTWEMAAERRFQFAVSAVSALRPLRVRV